MVLWVEHRWSSVWGIDGPVGWTLMVQWVGHRWSSGLDIDGPVGGA